MVDVEEEEVLGWSTEPQLAFAAVDLVKVVNEDEDEALNVGRVKLGGGARAGAAAKVNDEDDAVVLLLPVILAEGRIPEPLLLTDLPVCVGVNPPMGV